MEVIQLNLGVDFVYYFFGWLLIIDDKDDSKAFIFTLKNPHGVEPTRYMKRRESYYAFRCYPHYGPIFGNYYWSYDIFINDNCNRENSCSINNVVSMHMQAILDIWVHYLWILIVPNILIDSQYWIMKYLHIINCVLIEVILLIALVWKLWYECIDCVF